MLGLIEPEQRTFVSKPWGWEDWIWNSHLYCGKVLFVKEGKACSYHYHQVKDETFFLLEGELLLRYSSSPLLIPPSKSEQKVDYANAKHVILRPGSVFRVPPGMRHQFYAMLDSKLIEYSTYHSDGDTVRLDV